MKPYYQGNHIRVFNKDCRDMLELPDESVDLIATDPPYGIAFMGKDWDRALPDKAIWAECLRILKPGAFAFVMSIPRADCLSRMTIALEDAGFWVNFTPIFWAFASGFPKAQNIYKKSGAEKLDGSYGGFQPKPAVEVILVAMKPLSEKTFADQALKNGKGITWLDDGRIPGNIETTRFDPSRHEHEGWRMTATGKETGEVAQLHEGRFPANLLVSDDVLNDGIERKSGGSTTKGAKNNWGDDRVIYNPMKGSSVSFSRYFNLDAWWAKTFPFLIVPKASKSEKNRGIGGAVPRTKHGSTPRKNEAENKSPNYHPTVKPVKLMSYLIILGSREGDTVVDPFIGTGSTAIACQILGRSCTGYEINPDYCKIAKGRLTWCRQMVMEL